MATGSSFKLLFHKIFRTFSHIAAKTMEYLQFKFTAKGPDGRNYQCTMFHELSNAPDEAQAIAHAERNNPSFTDIRVASVITISEDEYAFRVRVMCDSDTWGFQPIP